MSKSKNSAGGKARSKSPKDDAAVDLSALPDRRAMERVMRQLTAQVSGRGSGQSALDRAQEIMYDAFDTRDRARQVELALKALDVSADCADAYVLLAEVAARSLEEAAELYGEAVKAGERAIGRKNFKDYEGRFWGFLETRPYMRARQGLADCLWAAGRREEAVAHHQEMLRLNPNDNQGIRDALMPHLIELGRDDEAEALFKQYKEDGTAAWAYSRALLDFRKSGDSPAVNKSLAAAVKKNEHIPAYLLGRKALPRSLPSYYGVGDDNEAIIYAHGNRAAWKASRSALDWLAKKAK